MKCKTMEFKHCVVEGIPYEAGKQLGNMLKDDKAFITAIASPFMGGSKLSKHQLTRVMDLYDKFCPGTNDEIKGFADAILTIFYVEKLGCYHYLCTTYLYLLENDTHVVYNI